MITKFDRPYLSATPAYCMACESAGFILDTDTDTARACVCQSDHLAARLFTRARVPAGFFGACRELKPPAVGTMERGVWRRAAKLKDALVIAAVGLEGSNPPLDARVIGGIAGGPGAGKSWLLASAVWSACLSGIGGAYLSIADPFAAFKAFGDGDLDRGGRRARRVPFLALDDVGGHRNETSSSMVRDLIQARLGDARVTLVATRNTAEAIGGELGWSVADALRPSTVVLLHDSMRA